jgi:hypothetical protein
MVARSNVGNLQLHLVSGVSLYQLFPLTCISTIQYPNYKFHFSIRALGRFEHEYLPAMNLIDRA